MLNWIRSPRRPSLSRAMTIPTLLNQPAMLTACIPGAELHNLPLEFQDVDVVSFDDWEPYYNEIAETFDGFMQKTVAAE